MVSAAIAEGDVQAINYFVAQYVEAFKELASSPNQKLVLMPMEASGVIGSIAGVAELAKQALGDQTTKAAAAATADRRLTCAGKSSVGRVGAAAVRGRGVGTRGVHAVDRHWRSGRVRPGCGVQRHSVAVAGRCLRRAERGLDPVLPALGQGARPAMRRCSTAVPSSWSVGWCPCSRASSAGRAGSASMTRPGR